MTDHEQGPESAEPAAEAAEEASVVTSALGDFSTGEGMVAIGGIIILVVWLLFEVILEEYGVPHIAILLAAGAAILPRLNRDTVEKVMSLPSLMKVIGYGLAIVGVIEIVEDLRNEILSTDAATVIAALAAYAGYAVAFIGARSVKA
jgi:hypothetical protein